MNYPKRPSVAQNLNLPNVSYHLEDISTLITFTCFLFNHMVIGHFCLIYKQYLVYLELIHLTVFSFFLPTFNLVLFCMNKCHLFFVLLLTPAPLSHSRDNS